MSEERTFAKLLDELTNPHWGYVRTDNGQELKEQPALLVQLREAMFVDMEGTGGSAAFGSKPPIDAGAFDLLEEISTQAAQALASVDPRPTPLGQAEHYVRLWSAATTEDEILVVTKRSTNALEIVFDERIEVTAYGLLSGWVRRIETFFNAPKPREITEPCPNCGERYLEVVRDGQTLRTPAFNFLTDRETNETTEAKCSACGESWNRGQFAFLAVAIGAVKEGETYDEVVARHAGGMTG